MVNLIEYIKEELVQNILESINNEIICEKLNAQILKDLAAQLLNLKNKSKENGDWKINKNFKEIFGSEYNGELLEWDKISDSDITTIDAKTWEDEKLAKKNEKLIRNALKDKTKSLIITKNPEINEFDWVIYPLWHDMVALTDNSAKSYTKKHAGDKTISLYGNRKKDIKNADKIELCRNKTLYIIDCEDKIKSIKDLKQKRYLDQKGSINFDPESLKRIARDNVERYKKIIAKNGLNRQHNDKLIDRCKTIIDKVAEISVKVAKDPIRYADNLYDVDILSQYVYGEVKYQSTGKYSGYYSGKNGILPTLIKYAKNLKEGKTSTIYPEMYKKDMEANKKALEKSCDEAEQLIQKLNI